MPTPSAFRCSGMRSRTKRRHPWSRSYPYLIWIPDSQHNALPAGSFVEVTYARHDGQADVAVDPNFGSGDRMERVADQLSVTGRRDERGAAPKAPLPRFLDVR